MQNYIYLFIPNVSLFLFFFLFIVYLYVINNCWLILIHFRLLLREQILDSDHNKCFILPIFTEYRILLKENY